MPTALRSIVEQAAAEFAVADPERVGRRPAPDKWNAREILGHLIDSATNNHGRFVTGAGREDLVFAGYDQEEWVRVQRYDDAAWLELVVLWRAYNLHIARVMDAIPAQARNEPRARHNFDRLALRAVPVTEPSTLGYLMDDYVAHLEHHLRQIRALLA